MAAQGTKRRRPSSTTPTAPSQAIYVAREDPLHVHTTDQMGGEVKNGGCAQSESNAGAAPDALPSSPKRRPSLELMVNPARESLEGNSCPVGGMLPPRSQPGGKNSPETLHTDDSGSAEGAAMASGGGGGGDDDDLELTCSLNEPGDIMIVAERAETDSFLHTASNYRLATGMIRRGSNEWHGGM